MKNHQKLTTAQAIGLGAVAGMRSMRLPALLARGRGSKFASALQWAAAAEFLADKLPFIPARTRSLSVLGRMLTGAGSAIALTVSRQPVAKPALTAAGAALASTFALHWLRSVAPSPAWMAALVEDAVATSLGRSLVG